MSLFNTERALLWAYIPCLAIFLFQPKLAIGCGNVPFFWFKGSVALHVHEAISRYVQTRPGKPSAAFPEQLIPASHCVTQNYCPLFIAVPGDDAASEAPGGAYDGGSRRQEGGRESHGTGTATPKREILYILEIMRDIANCAKKVEEIRTMALLTFRGTISQALMPGCQGRERTPETAHFKILKYLYKSVLLGLPSASSHLGRQTRDKTYNITKQDIWEVLLGTDVTALNSMEQTMRPASTTF
ncbi:hypothetical protein K438DRAFT_1774833 [Mycena galopus ATCC 62051]|nr:hypothetical protein K438DRAFT_1774833 [Mycena galopus ATCC 62051]